MLIFVSKQTSVKRDTVKLRFTP